MTRQYISGPPNMDPYADLIGSGAPMPAVRHVVVPEFRHRRRSPWRDVCESPLIRGMVVAFVLVAVLGLGVLIARVTS